LWDHQRTYVLFPGILNRQYRIMIPSDGKK